MKYEDLLAIVDFLYRGEANIYQENLDSFLAIAEELQLKGLMGKTDEKIKDIEADQQSLSSTFLPASAKIPKTSFKKQAACSKIQNPREERAVAIPSFFLGILRSLKIG